MCAQVYAHTMLPEDENVPEVERMKDVKISQESDTQLNVANIFHLHCHAIHLLFISRYQAILTGRHFFAFITIEIWL